MLFTIIVILIFPTQNSFASGHSVNWQFSTYDLSFEIVSMFAISETDAPAITDSATLSIEASDAPAITDSATLSIESSDAPAITDSA